MKYDSQDVDIAARTAWGEARGAGLHGMLMVLWVIRNRALDPRWPDRPADVALQDRQFSAWNDGNPNRPKMEDLTPNDMLFRANMAMARAIFESLDVRDPTLGATHYFADYIDTPTWAENLEFTVQLGHHRFYR